MIQLVNMVGKIDSAEDKDKMGKKKFFLESGCHGIETIFDGTNSCDQQNKDMTIGYHLMFYADWLDFWRQDTNALNRKFGSPEAWKQFYLGSDKEALINQLREDLKRAEALESKYVVFHVSDVSIEEGFNYSWEHKDEEIIDASAELINLILDGENYNFEFLIENLHWPGFSFTNPEMTDRILKQINYDKKGIMLDTGHLMCTNLDIKNEEDGCQYIHEMLDKHGELCKYIRGIHMHKSVSGDYVKWSIENQPVLTGDYYEKFAKVYEHIGKIDTHQPFSSKQAKGIVERINPEYLVHEISANSLEEKLELIKIQKDAIGGIK